jgi:hypothetical protein
MTFSHPLATDQAILDQTAASVSDEALLRRFIGPNANYYIDVWKRNRSKDAERRFRMRPSWNWPAALFLWTWVLYRKMWLLAFLAFLLMHVLSAFRSEGLVLSALMIVATGVYGNSLYLRHALARIAKIRASSSSEEEVLKRLEKAGGASKGAVWSAFGAIVAFIFLLWLFAQLNLKYHFIDFQKAPGPQSQVTAPAPKTITTSPTASSAPNASAANRVLPARAVLYEEDAMSSGHQYSGSVVWRTAPYKPSAGNPDDVAVFADVEIPERNLRMTLSLRRNFDSALPASHVAEFIFNLPSDSPGFGIDKVPGLLMKSDERSRGVPLRGLSVKIAERYFLMGLSNIPEDRAFNQALLHGDDWIDVPIMYSNQGRAIIAIEKGDSGKSAFRTALAAWDRNP